MIETCMGGVENPRISPLELETQLRTRLVDGVTTTQEIQNNLIQAAVSLAKDLESSEWLRVAGALNLWDLKKQIDADRPDCVKDSLYEAIKFLVKRGYYENSILDLYTQEDITEFEKGCRTPEYEADLLFDYAGSQLLRKRYLLPLEKPQEMFKVCALWLAVPGSCYSRVKTAIKIYDAIASLKISLATPFLSNLRTPRSNLSSCFITKADDSLESIMSTLTDTASISKQGGGIGINLSDIRSRGSMVAGVEGASGGVVPWIKLFNDLMIAVSQVKSNRKGAATVAIEVWHQDIFEFLELQTENGDLRSKAYDIFPQVVINDAFMEAVENNEPWFLFDPYDLRQHSINLVGTFGDIWQKNYLAAIANPDIKSEVVNAKELQKQIMKTQIETGLPYLFFKDTVNKVNLNNETGIIPNANLCVESFSNFDSETTHCCNLVSLNLARIDIPQIEELCHLSVQILDNAIDLTENPTEGAQRHNKKYRTIGVGVMGLADHLVVHGLTYKNLNEIEQLFKHISYYCLQASVNLAKDRGCYPMYEPNKQNWIDRAIDLYWDISTFPQLLDDLKSYGVRNGQIMAIAPNTSTSLLYGCTASILPPYNLFFVNKDGQGTIPVVAPYALEFQEKYTTNKELDQNAVVLLVSTIQPYIDQGISMELIYDLNDPNFNAKYMYDLINFAWNAGCKTIYYTRTVQKSDTPECTVCAN
ncbi:MAG: ribonucleoside-diphosphate reductase subunit alpha [Waterburya sp.]